MEQILLGFLLGGFIALISEISNLLAIGFILLMFGISIGLILCHYKEWDTHRKPKWKKMI
jgi:hypothetical protein